MLKAKNQNKKICIISFGKRLKILLLCSYLCISIQSYCNIIIVNYNHRNSTYLHSNTYCYNNTNIKLAFPGLTGSSTKSNQVPEFPNDFLTVFNCTLFAGFTNTRILSLFYNIFSSLNSYYLGIKSKGVSNKILLRPLVQKQNKLQFLFLSLVL